MILGKSKSEGLFQKISTEDSRYREDYYRNHNISWTEEPLVSRDLPALSEGSAKAPDMGETRVEIPVQARLDDVQRITKLLATGPGVTWLAHQAELELIQKKITDKRLDPKTSTMDAGQRSFGKKTLSLLKNVGTTLLDSAALTATTLGQVAVAGTGYFTSPLSSRSYLGGESSSFWKSVADRIGTTSAGTSALEGQSISLKTSYAMLETDIGKEVDTSLGKSKDSGLIEKVKAEQGESYGRVQKSNLSLNESTGSYLIESAQLSASSSYFTRLSGIEGTDLISGSKIVSKYQSSDDLTLSKGVHQMEPADDGKTYIDYNSDFFYSEGKLSNNKYTKDSSFYMSSHSGIFEQGGEDGWSPTDVHKLQARNPDTDAEYEKGMVKNSPVDPYVARIEMIPFWIQALAPPDATLDNCVLYFEANLSSYNDSYTGDWNNAQYVGRADKFYTYAGFDRQIDFGFKAVAKTIEALRPIYNRLNGLAGLTAPTYNSQGAFMRGTLAKIRIGDLLTGQTPSGGKGNGQTGFIKSVKFTWQTDYQWEIGDGERSTFLQVPHVLDVSVSFTPIHTFIPQDRRRYYGLVDGNSNNTGGVPLFLGDRYKMYPSNS